MNFLFNFFCHCVVGILNIFWKLTIHQIYGLQKFFSFCRLPFHFGVGSLALQKFLIWCDLIFVFVACISRYLWYCDVELPRWRSGKESACQCRRRKRHGFDPCVGKSPWRRKRQPTPVFLPGKSHGQRSLVGYNLLGSKESDTTEKLSDTVI